MQQEEATLHFSEGRDVALSGACPRTDKNAHGTNISSRAQARRTKHVMVVDWRNYDERR